MKKLKISLFIFFMIGRISSSWAEAIEAKDKSAEYFIVHCADCHTVGGGELTGPDLIAASKWSRTDLKTAVKKMEENVGPLSPADIDQITEFLKDPDVSARIAKQKQTIESNAPAVLPPHAFETGEKLFRGNKALTNGGPACISCHRFANEGGSLGPELTLLKNRLSGAGLQSSIENANFKIMRRIYENRKITKEESLCLSEYLSHPEKTNTRFAPTLRKVVGSAGVCFFAFFVLLLGLNRQIKGRARENLSRKNSKKVIVR